MSKKYTGEKFLAYVSGPYRDGRGTVFVEDNIRRAEDVAKKLWQIGYAVICPHANTRHFDGVVSSEEFIDGDLAMIAGCDLVVMLPGWKDSEGARIEREFALEKGINVVEWEMVQQAEALSKTIPEALLPLAYSQLGIRA